MKSLQFVLIVFFLSLLSEKVSSQVLMEKMDSLSQYILILNSEKQDSLKKTIDNLKRQLYYLKSEYYKIYYKTLLHEKCKKIDTTFKSKDSIVVKYLAENGDILREDIDKFTTIPFHGKDTFVQEYLRVTYFNDQCLTESFQVYELIAVGYDCPEQGMICYSPIDKHIIADEFYPRVRLKYDNKNRLIYFALNSVAKFRVRYCYREEFNESGRYDNYCGSITEDITEFEFWDD